MTKEIQSRLEWIGVDWVKEQQSENTENHHPAKKVRVLDYACGPGMVSRVGTLHAPSELPIETLTKAQALAPYATEFRGIDVSENMVNEYNARASSRGFSPTQMLATRGDLLAREKPTPSVSGPDFYDFDLAVVDLGFHHFEDPALAAKRLVERLKPGKGVLLIIDFVPHEHAAAHHDGEKDGGLLKTAATYIVAHHGFARVKIEGMLKDAGCVDVDYVVLEEPLKFGGEMEGQQRTVFMIRGRRQD